MSASLNVLPIAESASALHFLRAEIVIAAWARCLVVKQIRYVLSNAIGLANRVSINDLVLESDHE